MYLKQFFSYIFTWFSSSVGPTGPTQKVFFVKFSLPVNFFVLIRIAFGCLPVERWCCRGGEVHQPRGEERSEKSGSWGWPRPQEVPDTGLLLTLQLQRLVAHAKSCHQHSIFWIILIVTVVMRLWTLLHFLYTANSIPSRIYVNIFRFWRLLYNGHQVHHDSE